ncbi:MAG: hypothetical protein ACRCSG_08900 [Cellulosilyticaceae bacterium]
MANNRQNLNISGAGSCSGGSYENVNISGSGKVTGDIVCSKFSSSGSSKIEGSATCDIFESSGTNKIKGNLRSKKIRISGTAKIEGCVFGDNIKISGAVKIEKGIKGDVIGIYGSAKIDGDIEAEEITIKGGMNNNQCINAESVYIETRSIGSKVMFNEIGATTVIINENSDENIWHRIIGVFRIGSGYTKGRIIEADVVKMNYAEVDVIRGKHIKIGSNCYVKLVEYSGTLEVSPGATIGESRKVER